MDDLKCRTNSIELFLAELHVPDSDIKDYAKVLRSNGYEDIVFLLDDIPVELLESFMRHGHASRVIKRLKALKCENFPGNSIFQKYGGIHNQLLINMDHTKQTVSQNPGHGCYHAGSFEISPSGIDSVPHGLPSALSLSISPPRHTQEAIIVIREIGQGASGTVYECLYIPTLTFVAVRAAKNFGLFFFLISGSHQLQQFPLN